MPEYLAGWGLQKLQRLIDQCNARRELIYNVSFSRFHLLTNHPIHTIGPGGDFQMSLRPVNIEHATLILNPGGQEVETPISVRNDQWWASQPLKQLTSTIATDLYYSPDVPLGNCFFWPITTVAFDIVLEIWVSLPQAASLDTSLVMAQGYWDWVTTELAIQLCGTFGREPSGALQRNNLQALRAILPNNDEAPLIATDGQGIPSGRTSRPDYNWLTGMRE